MITLRDLKIKDAPLMLEWMKDNEISSVFAKDMSKNTIDDVEGFCRESFLLNDRVRSSKSSDSIVNGISLHFAIVDDSDDEYRGTISLKNIDIRNNSAEYAISTRKKFHGTDTAKSATVLILKKAFKEYRLHRVYLNVMEKNERAIHFYKKCGFIFEGRFRDSIIKDGIYENLEWYSILFDEFEVKWGHSL